MIPGYVLAGLCHTLHKHDPCEIPLYNQNTHRKASNIRRILVGNSVVDHSDVVGASPVGAALTASLFSTSVNNWFQWIGQRQLQDKMRNI